MASQSKQRNLPGWEADQPPKHPADAPVDRENSRRSAKRAAAAADLPIEDEQHVTAVSVVAAGPQPTEVDPRGWQVFIVDAYSLIFQVFHALPEMTSPRGEPVSAVYGFVRDMLYLIEEKKPDALVCAFDAAGRTFRDDIYEPYKADRAQMPDELASQIPKIERVLEALAVPVLLHEGYEADDILATLARICGEQGAKCFLVSGDKDCRQLITDGVSIFNIRKNEVFDAAALERDWGIRPEQVIDFQALVGDKIDNIPGVPTIGPKTAQNLLQTYGTLDEVLAHAYEVPGAKGKKLVEGRESALVSRELVRLDNRVPVLPDWAAARTGGMDPQRLVELFTEFGFRTFAERAARLVPSALTPAATAEYHVVDTPAKLAELVAKLGQQDVISIDTETTHLLPRWAEIVGFSFAFRPTEAYYVPVRGPAGDVVLDPEQTLAALRPILENAAIKKIGQNLKYDLIVLRAAGVELRGVVFDTMVASYLLDAGERSHNLDILAKRYLNHQTIQIDELIGKGKQQKRMDEVAVADVATYAAEDADVPLRLRPVLASRLQEMGLTTLNETLEVPLIAVLADMEFTGVKVDPQRLAELSQRYSLRLAELERQIEELAGHPLNIGSPKQLAQVLFVEQGLPVVKKTKTGPSTDAEVLEQLAELHPLPAKIVEYRQFAKLKNTYVDALPAMIHPATQRVHASFNQVVAATGRLSSSEPNLQNIPIRSAEGREIRSAFIAGPPVAASLRDAEASLGETHLRGRWKLLAADYSQIELRMLAHFCGDPALRDAFAKDEDIHTLVASQVFGVPASEVTPNQRRTAKAVNFGIIYGQSPFGLAKTLGITQEEAGVFIDGYFVRYPGVAEFFDRVLRDCCERGYVQTILGRRRAIQGVRTPEVLAAILARTGRRQMNLPERTAVNTVIQGSAADLIKLAMTAIHRRLREESLAGRMILQIHDELVFESPADEIDALAAMVRDVMRSVLDLSVSLKVDIKSGENWEECEPWNL